VGLRVIHEAQVPDDPEFQAARKLISEAERLVFLGFGYHDANVRRLLQNLPLQEGVEMSGSFKGFREREMLVVLEKIEKLTGRGFGRWSAETTNILEMDIRNFLLTFVAL
jgi:hypothetical protein